MLKPKLLAVCFILMMCICVKSHGVVSVPNTGKLNIGAYYFGGWSRIQGNGHLPEKLKTEFKSRKPVWGWHDDTKETIEYQINLAHNSGLSFWAFDWYWPPRERDAKGLHRALDLYDKAKNKQKIKFCIMVANHEGGEIGPNEWDSVCKEWIDLFVKKTYLKIDNKPVVILFDPRSLINKFNRDEIMLKRAIDKLEQLAVYKGFGGVHIGACALPGPENSMDDLEKLERIGFKFFTNYNLAAFPVENGNLLYPYRVDRQYSFENLMQGHEYIWNQYEKKTRLPYYPVVTTGWDKRPWEELNGNGDRSIFYIGRTPEKVGKLLEMAIAWHDKRRQLVDVDSLMLLYAWNELGEGGYIVPTDGSGDGYLKSIKKVIRVAKKKKNYR